MLLYALDAAMVVLATMIAVYVRFHAVDDVRTGTALVGLGLLVGGLLSIAPAVSFASSTGFSTLRSVQAAEIAIVADCCAIGISAGARAWLSLHRARN